jgi:tRNA U54 and U55 pseudouridine synthase Pus10
MGWEDRKVRETEPTEKTQACKRQRDKMEKLAKKMFKYVEGIQYSCF